MVTIGAEDLVTRAEDLYGEGPVMFYYHKLLTRTIYFSLNIYTATRFRLNCSAWLGRPLCDGRVEAAEVIP